MEDLYINIFFGKQSSSLRDVFEKYVLKGTVLVSALIASLFTLDSIFGAFHLDHSLYAASFICFIAFISTIIYLSKRRLSRREKSFIIEKLHKAFDQCLYYLRYSSESIHPDHASSYRDYYRNFLDFHLNRNTDKKAFQQMSDLFIDPTFIPLKEVLSLMDFFAAHHVYHIHRIDTYKDDMSVARLHRISFLIKQFEQLILNEQGETFGWAPRHTEGAIVDHTAELVDA